MYTIAVINQKGGVGKSTTAHAVGAGLFRRGYRVMFADLDAQCNLSGTAAGEMPAGGATALEVLTGRAAAAGALVETACGSLIPGDAGLAGADILLTGVGKEYRLREAIAALSGSFDCAVIDTPPALGILTINALVAADGCLIPSGADIYSLQGVTALRGTVDAVKRYCNPALDILGILLTRYNGRTVIARDAEEMTAQAAAQFGAKLYGTKIRECTALKEAQAVGKNIYDYAPKSNAAADYDAFVTELLADLRGKL